MYNVIKEFNGEFADFSNFAPSLILFPSFQHSCSWKTVEHCFQAMKSVDPFDRRKIRYASTPGKAKRLGRVVDLRPNWEEIKVPLMRLLVWEKFKHSASKLQKLLLSTGSVEIQEGNRWGDRFWGVDLDTGEGRNELGKILMKIRAILR